MLSQALTSHIQYDEIMKKLSQLDDTENTIEIKTRVQERLKELERNIKEDQDRWLKEYEEDVDDEIEMDYADRQTPISFDVSVITCNNTDQTTGTTTISDEITKENSGVASCLPIEENTTPILEEEFKTQGRRRRSNKLQLDEEKIVKKNPTLWPLHILPIIVTTWKKFPIVK
ncbi:hypothetical protein AVEN_14110-1 [Araneus ventricosus]|uniref:Uncharacterized protein n=1 Tax=Araneus ventricosus TaxID=182803 RepID=A0A4Y2TKE1_ARAVE|nr:hypothetical protein AVEN_14110-1 [Araneus ventricosus]